MATHSSILAWKIPRTEDSGELQSMGSQRALHNWVTNTKTLSDWAGSVEEKKVSAVVRTVQGARGSEEA